MANEPDAELLAMGEIYSIIKGLDPAAQQRVFNWLTSKIGIAAIPVKSEDKHPMDARPISSQSINTSTQKGDLSDVATVTPEGQFHLSVRDLKASNTKDATKRLVYVIIRSYTQLMKTQSVSRKDIINPELLQWRLASGSVRGYIAADKGIIVQGDQLSLDQHALNEADQFINEIQDPSKVGSWKPESGKRIKVNKSGSEAGKNQDSKDASVKTDMETNTTSQIRPHSLEEIKTTSTIAQILNVKTEKDLILAAAMKFCLIDNKNTFTRLEILNEMKTATFYYRASYLNNASGKLGELVTSGKLRENATGVYALSMNTMNGLRKQLGLQ